MIAVKWLGRLTVLALGCVPAAAAAETRFPYDSELIMDVQPMRGSKRIPNMDVDSKGTIALEMCATASKAGWWSPPTP